ncbi:MAG: hypothetical protein GXY40_00520 [Syntrophomonadaceae bacterium]|nr:hypothetical protein [Syntrophomonadaceae bacterium]
MTDREFQKFMIEKMAELSENVNSLQQNVNSIQQDVNGLHQDVNSLQQDVNSLQQDVNGLHQDVNSLRQVVTRIEINHGEKLSALFDGYEVIKETLDDHTHRLERIEAKLETHEIQIKVLDSTKANKRTAK